MTTDSVIGLISALAALAGSQFALWLRFEHRMTVLEERLRLREKLEDRRYVTDQVHLPPSASHADVA